MLVEAALCKTELGASLYLLKRGKESHSRMLKQQFMRHINLWPDSLAKDLSQNVVYVYPANYPDREQKGYCNEMLD